MNLRNYDDRPVVVVWEMTRACRLACVHCRAEARTRRDPAELTTEEGHRLIEQVAALSPWCFILSGGDPSRREDLIGLIEYAAERGVRVALSPGATPDFLKISPADLRGAGVGRLSFSLDGATEASHNRFRGVSRAWEWTMRGISGAKEAGLPFQINSTVTAETLEEFEELAAVVERLGPVAWTIFLLVPTGRGHDQCLPSAAAVERLFERLCELSRRVPFAISTTEGQHFRRVLLQNAARFPGAPAPRVSGVNDARGFVFVSHRGEVCPSGFLPLVAGNVRRDPLIEIYREASLFRKLRNADELKGKCGRCEYRTVCGGSRARAFALTGDPFAEEPLCSYQPAALS
jgi:radical SAM protein with 4Fe4S-binding SPASM domain